MTRFRLAVCAAMFACSLLASRRVRAQEEDASATAAAARAGARRSLRAAPRTGAIVLDGRIDDLAWEAAPVASDFVQRYPVEGGPAQDRTEVRILIDETAVWVAARMFDHEPETIARQLVRRDQDAQADYFEVAFDSNRDKRTGFIFRVSAANVQRDEYIFDDNERDRTWDAVWSSSVAFDSLGWTAELRIPLSQLRFREVDGEQAWGVNFARRRVRSNEESHFALVSRLQRGLVSQFGELQGVRARSARRLELRPYALGSVFRGTAEAGNPFRTGRDASSRVGSDVRVGLGGAFTLDATINPDFGQVEADPAVINLSAFEQFYEERRPFFVEDAKIFDFSLSGGRNRLYYSRRMGRAPRGGAPEAALFADVPASANILGAAKLTGRTQRGLSLGALVAMTQQADGRAFLSDDEPERPFMVEPRARYGVLRLRQDFNGGASTIGVIGTGLARSLPADRTFDFLPQSAFNGGIDWEHQWGNRMWGFFGYVAGSHVRGDSVAMIRLQRASNHFFQRPDYRGPGVDSSARTMSGYDWRMTVEKRRGDHWTGSVWAAEVSPGFEVNDAGFSTRQEVLDGGARVQYREINPGRWYRSYNVALSTFHNWSHDAVAGPWSRDAWGRAHVAGSVGVNSTIEFTNFWRLESNAQWHPETMDRSGTRGGPLMLQPRWGDLRFSLQTDQRARLAVEPSLYVRRGAMGSGNEMQAALEINMRPSSRLEVEVEPRFTHATIGAQYVGQLEDPGYAPTMGGHYFFGNVSRRELALPTRVNAAFSPTLSFQLFAQPLLSSGDYSNYKQLAAPASFAFTSLGEGTAVSVDGVTRCTGGRTCVDRDNVRHIDVNGDGATDTTIDEQDFNVRSLIGNAVIRWEYRPGSAIFLVWQRRQRSDVVRGDFAISRDWAALLRAPTDNTFLVKVSYWLPL
ncbi:MAG: carbohydrate binding family 9 domain-containing protein [Gemmatimonadaceae bacterium]|nr:carbohydrate binding family 9 domain-containing protein [Gemmatimonadaceae bacterium]